MLQDLLLNQMITKRDLSKTIKLSIYKINEALYMKKQTNLDERYEQEIAKLYTRLKSYEHEINDFIVKPKSIRLFKEHIIKPSGLS